MTATVALLLYDDVEVLDACGPFEVLSTANRVVSPPPFAVTTHAAREVVTARGGLRLLADRGLEATAPDVLLVPGGVQDVALADPALMAWVAATGGAAAVRASVCTGAFVLAAAGLLDERPVTTHWDDVALLRRTHPGLEVVAGPRWVDHGDLVTSAGISAGLDMALHLVERFAGRAAAQRTARLMDYAWDER